MKIRFTVTLTAETLAAYADTLGQNSSTFIVGDLTRTLQQRLTAVRADDIDDDDDDEGADDDEE